ETAEQPRALAYPRRSEPRPRPIRRAGIERDTEDGHVAGRDLVQPREPGERPDTGEPRNLERVERPERPVAAAGAFHPSVRSAHVLPISAARPRQMSARRG